MALFRAVTAALRLAGGPVDPRCRARGEKIIPARPGLGLRPAPWRMCIAGFCVSGWFDMHLQGSATLFFSPFLVFLNHVPEDVQVAFQAPLVFN